MDRQLYVLAFPELGADRAFVETFRARHDAAKATLVAAHVTLVFGTEALSEADFIAYATGVARATLGFDVTFTSAMAHPGHPSGAHVFLIPDQGHAEILTLHDRLYAGPLAGELRADLPFVPHMTIATVQDMRTADALATRVNADGVRVRGSIRSLSVVAAAAGRVAVLLNLPLRSSV
jgi:2'-5' RNA ligase